MASETDRHCGRSDVKDIELFRYFERSCEVPDLTILLILDEEERLQRLSKRGMSPADKETLEPSFRAKVLKEMRSRDRNPEFRPNIIVDLTGTTIEEGAEKLLQEILWFVCRQENQSLQLQG